MALLSVGSLTEVCYFYSQIVENTLADNKMCVNYIQNYVARQQHMYLLQEVQNMAILSFADSLDGYLSLLMLNYLRLIAIVTTLSQYRAAYEKNNPFDLPQHVHVVCLEI